MTSLAGSLAGSVAGPLSGPGAGAGDTIEDILGDLLVEYWDARYGVELVGGEVNSWAGQVQGVTPSAPAASNRLVYTAANADFNAQPTCGTRNIANKLLTMFSDFSSEILASGSRPYVAMVAAFEPHAGAVYLGLAQAGGGLLRMDILSIGGDLRLRLDQSPTAVSYAPPDTSIKHFYEFWIGADDALNIAVDGEVVATAAGHTLAAAILVVAFGGVAGFVGDSEQALAVICSSVPSSAQRAALRALAIETWGEPPPVTPETILGDQLIECWDARFGVALVGGEVDSWTGQRGAVLSAPAPGQRPIFALDGDGFGGYPVVQTSTTGARVLQNVAISPALLSAGDIPYIAFVGRVRVTEARIWLECGAGSPTAGYSSLVATGGYWVFQNAPGGAGTIVGGTADTSPHYIECIGDAQLFVDGVSLGISGGGGVIQDLTAFGLGFVPMFDNGHSDVNIAQVIVALGRPTDAQLAALRALAEQTWGTPTPPLGSFVFAGGVVVSAGGTPVTGG